MNLSHALKEWAIAVSALEQGDMILLLRKGGIREQGGKFSVDYQRVLLYPTYEHQTPDLLKSPYAAAVQSVPSGWHPDEIHISSFADITDIFQVTEETTVQALSPYHVWNAQFIEERLKWKPKSPLYVLALRSFKLAQPQSIPYQSEYGGCRSWIDLKGSISLEKATPALSDAAYQQQLQAVKTIVLAN